MMYLTTHIMSSFSTSPKELWCFACNSVKLTCLHDSCPEHCDMCDRIKAIAIICYLGFLTTHGCPRHTTSIGNIKTNSSTYKRCPLTLFHNLLSGSVIVFVRYSHNQQTSFSTDMHTTLFYFRYLSIARLMYLLRRISPRLLSILCNNDIGKVIPNSSNSQFLCSIWIFSYITTNHTSSSYGYAIY
jgi:hypothetical protein